MKKRLLIFTTLLVTVTVCIFTSCTKKQAVTSKYPLVKAPTGTYEGQYNNGVSEFLGIRYAAPIESFKRAQDVTTTTADVIEARNWGASCLQASNEQGGVSRDSCSHDCLYLNIWTKDVAAVGKPVMVWIHGGGYMSGSTTNPMYDGEFFVRDLGNGEDCVFVSINYRLSFLGGCDLSILEGYTDKYADAVNLTKLDQMQALIWINKNIGAWGGDADNITIFGQSSGGGAVYHLMADPDANRYFKRAIEQSGVPMFKVIMETKEEARENSKKIFEILGVNTVEELVYLSDNAILDKIKEIHAEIFTGARYADGDIYSATWWDDFRNGSAKNIDLLTGSMNGENDRESMGVDNYAEPVKDYTIVYNKLKERYKSSPDEYGVLNPFNYDGLIDEYLTLGNDKVLLMQDLSNDLAATYPSLLIAEAQSMWNKNTYLYYWEFTPLKKDDIEHIGEGERPMVSPWSRALHGTDIGFVFGTVGLRHGGHLSGDAAELSRNLVAQTQAAWYNFAKTGNPNNPLIPEWKAFSVDARETMVIKPDSTWRCEKDYRAAAMKILSVIRPYGEK